MPKTPNSSTVSYLSAGEFADLKDNNAIGMLAVDDGTILPRSGFAANARIAAVLGGASGEVESLLLASDRYDAVDLSQFNGVSQQYLKLLVANLAMYRLYQARGGPVPPETVVDAFKDAQEELKKLSSGEKILAFWETEDAGVATSEAMTPQDFQALHRFTDSCRRVLGVRNELKNRY